VVHFSALKPQQHLNTTYLASGGKNRRHPSKYHADKDDKPHGGRPSKTGFILTGIHRNRECY